jgi:hypothetical protein
VVGSGAGVGGVVPASWAALATSSLLPDANWATANTPAAVNATHAAATVAVRPVERRPGELCGGGSNETGGVDGGRSKGPMATHSVKDRAA